MNKVYATFDKIFIHEVKRLAPITSRVALAIIFIWFGAMKVIAMSPANPLVQALLQKMLPFVSFETFIISFGLFEVLIGMLFIIPRWGRIAILLLALHMITTILPLFLLPEIAWQGFLLPTMEGQYIIKNIAIVALGMGVIGTFHPMKKIDKKINKR